jgi:predicted PurR-regulated permease PerM
MASSIGIHPIFVFFALLLGGRVAGFWGLVLAMPVAGIVAALAEYVWRRIERERADETLVQAS